MKQKNKKQGYPWTLKEFPEGPVLKKDGKPFKYGSIIPLVGGETLGASLATQNKPSFLLTYSPFAANEKHLINYWPDVPYINLDEYSDEAGENQKSLDELKEYFNEVDFINAVPPCAGLSSLNTCNNKNSTKSRGSDAAQNEWIYKSSRFVLEHVKPKVLWGENAPALFTKVGQGVADKLAEIAKEYGYSFSMMKTNSLLHGLPQKRERTFYFFWNSPTAPILNYHVVSEPTQLIEYLNRLPKGLEHADEFPSSPLEKGFPTYNWLLNEVEKTTHTEFIARNTRTTLYGYIYKYKLIEKAKEFINANFPGHRELRTFDWIEKKTNEGLGYWDVSPHFHYTHVNALVARNMYNILHPIEQRYLSTREMFWIMGHPWDFNFVRNEKNDYVTNHLAQNVPVVTARDWTLEVMKFINGELYPSSETYFKQNNNKPVVTTIAKTLF